MHACMHLQQMNPSIPVLYAYSLYAYMYWSAVCIFIHASILCNYTPSTHKHTKIPKCIHTRSLTHDTDIQKYQTLTDRDSCNVFTCVCVWGGVKYRQNCIQRIYISVGGWVGDGWVVCTRAHFFFLPSAAVNCPFLCTKCVVSVHAVLLLSRCLMHVCAHARGSYVPAVVGEVTDGRY